ncbi:hypothetical protein P5G62_013565 [Neobacillus sp. 179-C4.2 HS]|uniref:DUF4021 domain-containing protein n=1 Tax=Neobacillus driksii TaxID=3035913 RepID=A0ABV4YTF7_9BACI|nr:hypothetical protein [Neobacillus sp. 179.-C4.2 HS]MDP5193095.1 hypothetical protein [Neobacillus sp. 179.-C4.2 HS]
MNKEKGDYMKDHDKEPQFQSGENVKKSLKGLYGLDPEMSLLSVSFATTENPYLNEHYQEDPKEEEFE